MAQDIRNVPNDGIICRIENLKKYYPISGGVFRRTVGHVKALDGVSLELRRKETVGVVGESGCGKSTLGKNMMLLQRPSSGKVSYLLDGEMKDILNLDGAGIMRFKKSMQMVFQDPYSSLNPAKKIFDLFDEPLRIHDWKDPQERKGIMEKYLRIVNLSPDYLYRFPHEFSGGQRQRICIARALCLEPEVVVCDEPVSSLDVSIQAQILNLMKEIQKDLGLTYVFIAHDLSVVQYMSDRIIVMYLGRVVEDAGKRELYEEPLHPYTRALLSAIPIPVLGAKKNRIILEGDVPSPVNKPSGCPFHTRCASRIAECSVTEPELTAVSPRHRVACHLYKGDV